MDLALALAPLVSSTTARLVLVTVVHHLVLLALVHLPLAHSVELVQSCICITILVKVIVHLDMLRMLRKIHVINVQIIVKHVKMYQLLAYLATPRVNSPISMIKLVNHPVPLAFLLLTLTIPALTVMLPAKLALLLLRTVLHVFPT